MTAEPCSGWRDKCFGRLSSVACVVVNHLARSCGLYGPYFGVYGIYYGPYELYGFAYTWVAYVLAIRSTL